MAGKGKTAKVGTNSAETGDKSFTGSGVEGQKGADDTAPDAPPVEPAEEDAPPAAAADEDAPPAEDSADDSTTNDTEIPPANGADEEAAQEEGAAAAEEPAAPQDIVTCEDVLKHLRGAGHTI